MTDYSKMSDFEINEAVSIALLQETANPDARYIAIENYCNSWADAGPIIVGNKICLSCYPNRNDWDAFTLSDKGYAEETTYDANPLRAAMIVFLMMQEKP